MNVRRLLGEPLLHFLLLGAALFILFGYLNGGDGTAQDEIVLDEAQLAHLVSRFERTWQRQPTDAEFEGLVESWIRDEILYREGLAMGVDIDDPIVRRRVAQKVDVFAETLAPYSATDEQLEEWLDDNAEKYRVPARYTLRQVFFDPERHGDELEDVISAARAVVEADPDAPAGDVTMLPMREIDIDASQIARTFGMQFAAAVESVPINEWSGPVRSGYGLHLVLIEAREDGRKPALDEVRTAVERDYLAQRIAETKETFYGELRKRYTVRIEAETPAGDES